jgi:hypothetical protein
VGIRSLQKKELIELSTEIDQWNNQYSVCRLSDAGEVWILENQDQFEFRKNKVDYQNDDLQF